MNISLYRIYYIEKQKSKRGIIEGKEREKKAKIPVRTN